MPALMKVLLMSVMLCVYTLYAIFDRNVQFLFHVSVFLFILGTFPGAMS
jgi:hypothetical protein